MRLFLFYFIFTKGTFRLACEHVLKTLKKGRETLLTLLEAFVYDPLVDWAVAEDTVGGGNETSTSSSRHRAVGGGGERDRHHIGGTATAFGATEMAFGIETARKQMQDEFTRDTLIIQFTELKPDWLQNRSVTHAIYALFFFSCMLSKSNGRGERKVGKVFLEHVSGRSIEDN